MQAAHNILLMIHNITLIICVLSDVHVVCVYPSVAIPKY